MQNLNMDAILFHTNEIITHALLINLRKELALK